MVKSEGDPDPDVVVISYGITSRAAVQAVREARRNGVKAASLVIQSLFPIPEQAIRNATGTARRVIVAEENLKGQYRQLILPFMGNKDVRGMNRIGRMITPGEILNAIG
jgi:2-oxoglutarate ferredoxin oxidoreductase subunit alpha